MSRNPASSTHPSCATIIVPTRHSPGSRAFRRSPNLEERFDTCNRKSSVKTVCMLAIQMVRPFLSYSEPDRRPFCNYPPQYLTARRSLGYFMQITRIQSVHKNYIYPRLLATDGGNWLHFCTFSICIYCSTLCQAMLNYFLPSVDPE